MHNLNYLKTLLNTEIITNFSTFGCRGERDKCFTTTLTLKNQGFTESELRSARISRTPQTNNIYTTQTDY